MMNVVKLVSIICLVAGSLLPASTVQAGEPAPETGPGLPESSISQTQSLTGVQWYNGQVVFSTIVNCPSLIQGYPYYENGVGTYVGFLGNGAAAQPEPYPYETYYLHMYIASLGFSCSGPRLGLEIALPPNTSLAITATNKVFCFYDGVSDPTECPQTLPQSTIHPDAFSIPSVDVANARTWPLPQGHNLEIQIPVKSSVPMTNQAFHANVWAMDGNASPWLTPQQGVFVFTYPPAITYPIPSTDSITTTTAKSHASLTAYGLTGPGYLDLGTDTTYGLFSDSFNITTSQEAPWTINTDWTPFVLQPGTTYHFRVRYFANNGTIYYGADQTFTTLAAPPTPTHTATQTATWTSTATRTPTQTATWTSTATRTPTQTPTHTATATQTPTRTTTSSQPPTATLTPTKTTTSSQPPTDTQTPTKTPTQTATGLPTQTPIAQATRNPPAGTWYYLFLPFIK